MKIDLQKLAKTKINFSGLFKKSAKPSAKDKKPELTKLQQKNNKPAFSLKDFIGQTFSQLKNRGQSGEPIQQDVLGVDIGFDHIKIIQLTKDKDDWILTKYISKHVDINSDDEEVNDQERTKVLKSIILEEKFNTENVAVSLPVSSAVVQVIQLPYLGEEELNAAAENGSLWENSISIPGQISDYSIFWQKVKENQDKNMMSILFVASRYEQIERVCNVIKSANLDPVIVDVRCFALQNVLKTRNVKTASIDAFVEISGDENYAVFIFDDLPFIYDIFVGDMDIEALKVGGNKIDDLLIDRLAAQIRSSVTSFLKQSDAPGLESIHITSSLSNFDKIFKSLKATIVEYKVEKLNPFQTVIIPNNVKEKVDADTTVSSMSVATGLATRRLDLFGYYKFVKAVSNINLLPNREEVTKKEETKITTTHKLTLASKLALLLALISVLFMLLLNIFYPSESQINVSRSLMMQNQQELDEVQATYEAHNRWITQVNKMNHKVIEFGYLQQIPRGVYVVELKHNRKGDSELSVKSYDPSLVNDLINQMSTKFKDVKLVEVGSDQSSEFKLSKISFKIK